ncbi:hypothetical protein L1987_39425 [Smallanthus sonchifolius]|uniref:Uncharacterized protein n=1 Tax=Smallanthus sonchifolius TaxID=185202 RepID=A0ACB9HM97_9ASTR|nr:hypothetical protein L1987_39425 [Smallanthus sonchifolius]
MCYFIFGDSLFDSGNNNKLVTTFKSDYLPYGIDFPQGELLGFDEYIPTYATVTDQHISQEVNYASGGSGIREETGSHMSLYNLGGRKIVVFGLGLIGCAPAEISILGTEGGPCVDFINDAVRQFNNKLKPIVDDMNAHNADAKFTFINVSY